jgi:branched-subunit amino acid transport protein
MSTWIALAVVAVGSYALRLAPLVVLERVTIPHTVERALTYAGPAAMAALTVSALVHDRDVTASPTTVAIAVVALAVAGLLTVCRRPFLVAVGGGLATYALSTTVLV